MAAALADAEGAQRPVSAVYAQRASGDRGQRDRARGLTGLWPQIKARRADGYDLSYPEDWVFAEHGADAARCRAFWASVFMAALQDDVRDTLEDRCVLEARGLGPRYVWLATPGALEVASLAGFEPRSVVERAQAAFANWPALDAFRSRLFNVNSAAGGGAL